MSAKTNSLFKLLRIALASVVGSLLWAGCTQPRMAVVDPEAIAYAPVDLTKQRPDTHPELRTGLWQMNSRNLTANTVVSPSVRTPRAPEGTVDSGALLSYNPEVINAVPAGAEDTIIVEAAGAERPQDRRRTWRERWFRREQVPAAPPVEKREIIIEREIEVKPQPDGYRPSKDNANEDQGLKLMDTLFVKRK